VKGIPTSSQLPQTARKYRSTGCGPRKSRSRRQGMAPGPRSGTAPRAATRISRSYFLVTVAASSPTMPPSTSRAIRACPHLAPVNCERPTQEHEEDAARSRQFSSLHFHSVKDRSNGALLEVTESIEPEFNAIDAIVLYLQSTVIFPSWTSPVRIRSPAPESTTYRYSKNIPSIALH
jgi:hypothetical protein